ncbi:MAG: DUF2807 domain-containing protein [Bacteroidetes bacterium]|nr:DUF2807 domain-containing protein [Bacteroidota bacterium]
MKSKIIFATAIIIAFVTSAFATCESSSVASECRVQGTNFYGLILKSNAQVVLSQGTETSVRIEGDAKNVSSVQTNIENGALVIAGKNDNPVTIFVTICDVSLLEVEGTGKIYSNQVINSDMLLLKVIGSGSIHVDVRSLSLGMIVKGNGKIYVKGSTGDSFTRVFGNGQVISVNLDTFKATTELVNNSSYMRKPDASATRRSVLKLHR